MSRPVTGGAHVDLASLFRPVASSVWVITAAQERRPVGFTAVSLVSVSTSPALVSFNIGIGSSSHHAVRTTGAIAAHLLADHQEPLARRFAGAREQRFAGDHWRWCERGVPELRDSLVRLVLEPRSFTFAGDSEVVIAQVTDSSIRTGRPLLHRDRAFHPADADYRAERVA